MKAYRNTAEIASKDNLGRRFSLIGLLVLAVGFVASLMPGWLPPPVLSFLQRYGVLVSFGSLFIGFACARLGSHYINRYARRPWPDSKTRARPDEVLERNMKGFDDKFVYFAHSLPASHNVLVGPCGILLFTLRIDNGKVVVNGDRWREPFSAGRLLRMMAQEGIGDPPRELAEQKQKLQAFLNKDGANFANVPIEGAVVFLSNAAQLELDNPTVPVLRLDQVKEYVRRKAKDVKLSNATLRELTDYLREHSKYQEEV
ncbi:MAG: hypothetical protein U0350_19715 [Caldilineaceae bacterium]